jgi:hypothetical protein
VTSGISASGARARPFAELVLQVTEAVVGTPQCRPSANITAAAMPKVTPPITVLVVVRRIDRQRHGQPDSKAVSIA